MEPNWATDHLQVIRTLMERTAIYRRAMAPVMLLLGILGILASILGLILSIDSIAGFGSYWMLVSAIGITGAYFKVRSQALRDSEPFWSPPTKRVTQAVIPPLLAGFVATIVIVATPLDDPRRFIWIPPMWMILYGCAIHAAGFFMPRGMKLFGWGFIVCGCIVAGILPQLELSYSVAGAHTTMGIFFGGLHLAYGAYLYFTERKNEA
ncbi:MAG: hypothetical protein O2960_12720 [Verrucomicrobia bacterium]|nr:hypothetical protein [Verrucomicrobiota bacterium]